MEKEDEFDEQTRRRLKRMSTYTKEDFMFYQELFDKLSGIKCKDKELERLLQKPEKEESTEEKWKRFQDFQKHYTKNQKNVN